MITFRSESMRVGFRIITIIDSTRVTKPLYNYFGEKETGDRHRKISIHLWYPAKPNTGGELMDLFNLYDQCKLPIDPGHHGFGKEEGDSK